MRPKIRRILIFISLFLFPLTLNYFSPYVSVDGAFRGIVAGSVFLFLILFLSGLVLRRAWCAWVCPIAGLSEVCSNINNKPVPVRKLRMIRYSIFTVWFAVLVAGFILAGGIKQVDPFHLTERMISVDEPIKFFIYYLVLFLFFGLSIWIGRRGACHSICWMSPFLVAGTWVGQRLQFPQIHIAAEPSACIDCLRCNQKCPMSIDVNQWVKSGGVQSMDCILCGECVDVCPKDVLRYRAAPKV